MAYYGIPSAGLVLSASNNDDVIERYGLSTAVVSATSVLGLDGGDIINLGAIGVNGRSTGTFTINAATGSGTQSVTLFGSGTKSYTTSVVNLSGAANTVAQVSGVITSFKGSRTIVADSQIYGNSGNDSIYLGNFLTSFASSTIGGGAGNDLIGTYTFISSVAELNTTLNLSAAGGIGIGGATNKAFVEGGGGDDTIQLIFSGYTSNSGSTIQGSQGNDSIFFQIDASAAATASQFLGGGGNDVVLTDVDVFLSSTIAGGGGNDTIQFSASGDVAYTYIAGDTQNTTSQYDGNDWISGNIGDSASSNSVVGGAGNDTIFWSGSQDAGSNVYQLNAGDDSIRINLLSASTIQAGAGNDTVNILTSMLGGSLVLLGGGDDHIIASAGLNIDSGNSFNGTVFGGAGADTFFSASVVSGGTVGITFGYDALTESTLFATDSVAVAFASGATDYKFNYTQGGLTLGTFSAAGVTGTNGVVTFTSNFDTNLTARVSAINSAMTTQNAVATFRDADGKHYLFVQGGASTLTDDNFIAVGRDNANTAATIQLGGGKLVTLTLPTDL